MALLNRIQIAAGTKANLNTLAGSSGLKANELYWTTDENKLYVGLTTSTYAPVSADSDLAHYGFVNPAETTISFNDSTYVFTLTDAGSGWSYYRNGIRYTVSGNKTTTLSGSPPTAGAYYIYIDATDGTLSNSTTPWTLTDTKVPVALILWNNSLTPKYWLIDERHIAQYPRPVHYGWHKHIGSIWLSGGIMGDYTVAPASPADDDNTFSLTECQIYDEGIIHTLASLSDPAGTSDAYTIFYDNAGSWDWLASEVPFEYQAAGYIKYDPQTLTQASAGKYVTYYLLYTGITGDARHIMIPGMQHDSLASAESESIVGLDLDGLPVSEFVAGYKLIFYTNASYSTKGKCRLAAIPEILRLGSVAIQSGASADYIPKTIITAKGDIIAGEISGLPLVLPVGSNNQVLTADSAQTLGVKWATPSSGMTNPMTTQGDIIYGGSSGAPTRLGKGTAGQVLTMNSGATAPEWATAAGGGLTSFAVTCASCSNTTTETDIITFTVPANTSSSAGDYIRLVANLYVGFNGTGTITYRYYWGGTQIATGQTGAADFGGQYFLTDLYLFHEDDGDLSIVLSHSSTDNHTPLKALDGDFPGNGYDATGVGDANATGNWTSSNIFKVSVQFSNASPMNFTQCLAASAHIFEA